MPVPRHGLMRDALAFLIVALTCPVAVFGGSNIGCVGQGFNSACAMTAVFISPLMLVAGGVLAGLVTRGWTGLLLVLVGVFVGMISILLLSFGVGKVVPLDPISGVIATIWFAVPMMIGYGMGRVIWKLFATRTH